ncbi:MAG: hypothetical protein D3909_02785 [Candidatus Electrothrix sp. ATG1]|nr:hypothetical protein [Candidatus Electrothrix sp. ATG1]
MFAAFIACAAVLTVRQTDPGQEMIINNNFKQPNGGWNCANIQFIAPYFVIPERYRDQKKQSKGFLLALNDSCIKKKKTVLCQPT